MEPTTLNWSLLKALSESNVNSIGANIPGAYRLSYKEDSDGNYYVFYVGESTDIKTTILEHLKGSKNACVAIKVQQKQCAFRYAETSDLEVRQAATKQAYHHYQPACNDSEPQGIDDIIVNLS